MSYDYCLMRLKRAITNLSELDDTAVSREDWYQVGRDVLLRDFSELDWTEDKDTLQVFYNQQRRHSTLAIVVPSSTN